MAVKKIEELNIHRDVNSTEQFDVQGYLNENWDKMQDVVDNNAEELMQAQKDISTLKEDNKTNKSSIDVLEKSNETRDEKISKNVEDIEAIQRSIKAATETINKKDNEQDEDIKANKESIKEIQAENERLREDIKSIATIGEASGENIHIEDSSNARCEIEIGGNQKQETREGYNQININDFFEGTRNGVTITKDLEKGSLTFNGTVTSTFAISIPLNLSKGTIISYSLNNSKVNKEVIMRLGIANGQIGGLLCDVVNAKKENFELTEDINEVQIRIGAGITLESFVVFPQLETNTSLHNFEIYGASPSIDYPSQVKSVGDNINMLFTNPDDWEQGTITDGANASSMTRIRTKNFIDIIDNEDYYVSIPNTQYCFLNIVLYKEDKTYIGQYYSLNNAINGANHLKINLPTDAKKIRVIIRNLDNVSDISPSDIEMIKPKLEKSSVATPYSSYNCGSLKTKIGNKNHLSTIPRVTFSLQGIQTTFDGEKFTCKGTAMYNYFNLVTQRIQQHFKAGTYTFSSNMFEKGRACIRFYYEDGTADTYYSHINTRKISFTLKKDAYEYFLMVDGLTVGGGDLIDCIIKLQLEDGNIATEIEKAENQEYLVDVQQPLLEGDTFVKQDEKWYEKHNFDVISTLNKSNIKVTKSSTSTDTFFRYLLSLNAVNRKEGIGLKIYSTHFINKNSRWARVEGICGWESGTTFCLGTFNAEYDTEEKVTNFLQNTDVKIYYELAEPILLECTEAQSKVLDEIYNKAHTYKNITNISAESSEVNPIASVKYLKDPETEHNKLQVQIDEIKQLLSSTETSALLVNNLEKDLRMEVE